MDRLVVVTGMWGTAYERYGRVFIDTFYRFWPRDTRLMVYTDRKDIILGSRADRIMLDEVPGWSEFRDRHSTSPVAKGIEEAAPARWRDKDRALRYSWRHDAMKWFAQGLIPADAARRILESGPAVMIWLDADVMTHAPVPADWHETLIGPHDGAYLGRPGNHSEIGFWAARLPAARPLADRFAAIYTSDRFLAEEQSHSAFIWDIARTESPGVRMLNLTPEGHGHVWKQSPLRTYTMHYKGERKAQITG